MPSAAKMYVITTFASLYSKKKFFSTHTMDKLYIGNLFFSCAFFFLLWIGMTSFRRLIKNYRIANLPSSLYLLLRGSFYTFAFVYIRFKRCDDGILRICLITRIVAKSISVLFFCVRKVYDYTCIHMAFTRSF